MQQQQQIMRQRLLQRTQTNVTFPSVLGADEATAAARADIAAMTKGPEAAAGEPLAAADP
jgi:hypothetical protein